MRAAIVAGVISAMLHAAQAYGATTGELQSKWTECEQVGMAARNTERSASDRLLQSHLEVRCYRDYLALVRSTQRAADSAKAAGLGEESKQALKTLMAAPVGGQTEADVNNVLQSAQDQEKQNQGFADFQGLSWGVAFGWSFAFDNIRDDATIVNGVVCVTSAKRQQPRLLLEYHKYFWCGAPKAVDRGCGPFVAVAASEDKVLSGVALGLMYGLKTSTTDSTGFSVGAGFILDSSVKSLASGFSDGNPPPNGETAVRFKTDSRWSGTVFVSRTF